MLEAPSEFPSIPGYRIERELGVGGMAKVYLAIQENFEREVALKVMSTALNSDPSFSERFIREARIVAKLMHPHIVTVHDVGVHEGFHYLAMQYVPGDDLKAIYRELSLQESLSAVKDVARALHFAARKGYVHRDVKPENIMIHNETHQAVLMDFGIARTVDAVSSEVTRTGTIIGTPQYMSPEQAKGEAVGHPGDLYSLGIVLYLLLCGRAPFNADSGMAVGIKHITEAPPPLPDHMAVFQPIIDKLLAKQPEERFENGSELVLALDAISEEELAQVEAGKEEALAARPITEAMEGADTVVSVPSEAVQVSEESDSTADADKDETLKEQATEIFWAGAEKKGVLKADTGDVEPSGEQSLTVSDEDRVAITGTSEERGNKGVVWWPVVASLLVGAGYLGWQTQFNDEVSVSPIESVSQAGQPKQNKLKEAVDDTSGQVKSSSSEGSIKEGIASTVIDLNSPLNSTDEEKATNNDTVNAVGTESAVDNSVDGSISEQEGEVERNIVVASLEDLVKAVDADILKLPSLLKTYQQKLQESPEQSEEVQNLIALRKQQVLEALELSLEKENIEASQPLLALLVEQFPEVETIPQYEKKLTSLEGIQSLLDQGDKYLEMNALAVPEGANAVEQYQAVLKLSPDNVRALQGLDNIAKRYGDLAKKALVEKAWKKTRRYLERGLGVKSDMAELLDLERKLVKEEAAHKQQLAQEEKRKKQIETHLKSSQSYLTDGRLLPKFEGDAENAWHSLQNAIALDASNKEIIGEIQVLAQRVLSSISSDLSAGRLDAAEANIVTSQSVFSLNGNTSYIDNKVLLELDRLREVFAEKQFEASRPKVSRMLVSAQPFESLEKGMPTVLPADRVIHIGFEFQNFEQETTVLQAILYDGSGAVKIAQVPVITQGKTGEQFFDISRPVEGFANGGYTIQLLKGVEVMASMPFLVEK